MATKIDVLSGFLGAGKTTLIKKLLAEALEGEKLVLIENEFGEISVDGGFLQETGVQVSELSSGCICCTLVGDFTEALKQVYEQYRPDRILIEPSGVAKLSDVIAAIEDAVKAVPELTLNSFVTVVDGSKVKAYMKNIPEYKNQVQSAGTIILSRTQKLSQEKLEAAVALLREKNPDAAILTTPWDELEGKTILSAIEKVSLADELLAKMRAEHEAEEAEHAHHHHDHGEHGDHEHRHGHGEQEECCHGEHGHHEHHGHGDHHHDHEEHGAHEHHHSHECSDPDCSCHHHHHHADEVFTSWGKETPKAFTKAGIEQILAALDSGEYGSILRAKGIVNGEDGSWIEFDFVPEEHEVRAGRPDYTGRLCVIGAELKEDKLARLFGL